MKTQLHPSGMEALAKCGIAYERRYIQGEKTSASARMAIGTAVDRSVRMSVKGRIPEAEHYRQYSELPHAVSLEEARDIARDALVSEWEHGVRLTEEDTEEGLTQAKGIDTSVSLSGFHYVELAPRLKPTHVARKIVLDVEGLSLQVAMELDIQEGSASIRDTKTSGKSPVKTLADESLQLSAYALGVRQVDGAVPEKVVLDYLIQTPKRGDLKLVQLESVRTDAQLQPVLERLAHMDKIIQSGIFTPAPIGAWWCSARYCAYHESCRFAARPVSVHVSSPTTGVLPGLSAASGGVSAISPPDDLEDRLRQSLEMANGTRKLHLIAKEN